MCVLSYKMECRQRILQLQGTGVLKSSLSSWLCQVPEGSSVLGRNSWAALLAQAPAALSSPGTETWASFSAPFEAQRAVWKEAVIAQSLCSSFLCAKISCYLACVFSPRTGQDALHDIIGFT